MVMIMYLKIFITFCIFFIQNVSLTVLNSQWTGLILSSGINEFKNLYFWVNITEAKLAPQIGSQIFLNERMAKKNTRIFRLFLQTLTFYN